MTVWPDKVDVTVPDAVTMKFDLSHIPAGSVIQYATLNMSLAQSDGRGDSYALSAHKIVGIDAGNHATLSQSYDTQSVNDAPGFRAWTLTRMVQEWVANPATNLGMVLDADANQAPGHFRSFASMESTDAQRRPFLQILYTTADGMT